MSDKKVVRTEVNDGVAIITIDNPPVNSLSLDVFAQLGDAFEKTIGDGGVKAIVLTGAGKTFSAGFDISSVESFTGPEQLREGNPRVYRMLEQMEDSAKPIVAAMKGVVLGGGLEVALACHYRVADETTEVGLPEVKIGLLPGGGGTQRLPRLVGLPDALMMICQGDQISVKKAKEIGLVDEVVESAKLLDEAVALAKKHIGKAEHPKARTRSDKLPDPSTAEQILAFAGAQVTQKAGKMVAPGKALECIAVGVTKGYDQGLQKELDNFIALAFGEQARALIHFFFASRATTRIPELADARGKSRKIAKVGVVGGGTMGRDIAFVHLLAGKQVTLLEAEKGRLEAAVEAIRGYLQRRMQRGKLTPEKLEQIMALLTPTLEYGGFTDVDLVIEAVFEKMEIKREVFTKLNGVVRKDTILASNTSTLPITELADVVDEPERVIGLHFFSPARVMPLLEVIRTKQTSKETIVSCLDLTKEIKKTPVLVGDCYGFLTNRIAFAYGSEANELLMEGASVQQIDKALVEFGLPMGPFTMGDMAGNDIGYHAYPGMIAAYPERSRPASPLHEILFAEGRFGQKVGKGFYLYEAGSNAGKPDPKVDELVAQARKQAGITPRSDITDQEIVERVILTWVNAAALCLEEKIALTPGDVDVATVMGFGFPPWRGGLMYYAQQLGYAKVCSILDGYAAKYGKIYAPSQWLRDQAK